MSYTLLSETRPIARKQHKCIWCGEVIPAQTKYVAECSMFDGEFQNHHWHEECLSSVRSENEDEYEFEPYENARPTKDSSPDKEKG